MSSRPLPDIPDGVVSYPYSGGDVVVTDEMRAVYERDGCFVIKNLLDMEEIKRIQSVLSNNVAYQKYAFGCPDGQGRESKLVLWSHPGQDITGMLARSQKVAGTCEQIMEGEVYHYHTKVMMKDAKTGGSHIWHQDYGYWYKNGCLKPDMMTAFIPLDPCKKINGCLQVIKGSHKCGRIDHELVYGQQRVDMERFEHVKKILPHVYAEIDPGDALFFHCNLLHCSDHNNSDTRRWCFLIAYNKASNDPVIKHHHPNYTKLHKVPNDAIKKCADVEDIEHKEFMNPADDKTINAKLKETGFH